MRRIPKYLILITLAFQCSSAISQTADELTTKTAFMVKMTHFINWPEAKQLENSSLFTICLEGSRNSFTGLKEWAETGEIKNKPVKLQFINGNPSKLENCNILYITTRNKLNTYIETAQKNQFLTISDQTGNAKRGVVINFYKANENLRFEINLSAARKSGFEISPRLLKLATIIDAKGNK